MLRIIAIFAIIPIFLTSCSERAIDIPTAHINRGINISGALEAPTEGEWGVVIEEWFFEEIAEKGFKSVRIPVRFSAYVDSAPPYTLDPQLLNRVDQLVEWAFEQNLTVIIDVHNFRELLDRPDENKQEFYAIWDQLTVRFEDYGSELIFELLNEPEGQLTVESWNAIQLEAVRRIREIDLDRWIMITGYPWGLSQSLDNIQLPEETERIIATFHFYEPYLFTHQGAPWLGEEYQTTGITWPGPPSEPIEPVEAAKENPDFARWFEQYNTLPYLFNPAGPKPIKNRLKQARDWSFKTGIPVVMGEFGTYEIIDTPSRRRWTRFVKEQADEYGISWIFWDFAGTFGILDLNTGEWNEQILEVLF